MTTRQSRNLRVGQHAPDDFRIRIACDGCLAEFPFSARRFLGEDVACERMPALHFASGCDLEALGRAFMGF